MMNRKWIIVLVLAVGGMAFLFFIQKRKVEFDEFTWSIRDSSAVYSYSLSNHTTEEITVAVVLVAENRLEGKDGTTLRVIGRTTREVTLTSQEKKKVEGVIPLSQEPSGATAISPHLAIKGSNESV